MPCVSLNLTTDLNCHFLILQMDAKPKGRTERNGLLPDRLNANAPHRKVRNPRHSMTPSRYNLLYLIHAPI